MVKIPTVQELRRELVEEPQFEYEFPTRERRAEVVEELVLGCKTLRVSL
jgi:hypothetical protein